MPQCGPSSVDWGCDFCLVERIGFLLLRLIIYQEEFEDGLFQITVKRDAVPHGHVASAAGSEREMNADIRPSPFFLFIQCGMELPTFRVGFLLSLPQETPWQTRGMWKPVFP